MCLELAWCRFHCKDQVAGIVFNNSIFSHGYIDFSYYIFDPCIHILSGWIAKFIDALAIEPVSS